MTDKVQKIREEVERFFNHVKDSNFKSDSGAFYYLKDLLDLIDSMQEKPVSDDLEKAALLYYPKMSRISEPHGIIPADNKSHYIGDANEDNRKAFITGADWQKEQIIKDAIEAIVKVDAGGYPYIQATIEMYDYVEDQPLAKEGDKVKMIVIKEY